MLELTPPMNNKTLCSLFGIALIDNRSLRTIMMMNDKNNVEEGNNDDDEDGVCGVFVNSDVKEGDAILKIPLSSCLRDDDPPEWFRSQGKDEHGVNGDSTKSSVVVSVQDWVARLTASLLDMKL